MNIKDTELKITMKTITTYHADIHRADDVNHRQLLTGKNPESLAASINVWISDGKYQVSKVFQRQTEVVDFIGGDE